MNNPTQLLPTSLIAVEVPKDSYQFEKENVPEENWHQLIYHIDNDDEESGFYGECEANQIDMGFDFEIHGEVTADEITFDVEPFVEQLKNCYRFKDYLNKSTSGRYFDYPQLSFYSLLHANGLYFENPIEKPTKEKYDLTYPYDFNLYGEDLAEWQEAESKVIKGKLVILKPI